MENGDWGMENGECKIKRQRGRRLAARVDNLYPCHRRERKARDHEREHIEAAIHILGKRDER